MQAKAAKVPDARMNANLLKQLTAATWFVCSVTCKDVSWSMGVYRPFTTEERSTAPCSPSVSPLDALFACYLGLKYCCLTCD